jgi:hypothetical protein
MAFDYGKLAADLFVHSQLLMEKSHSLNSAASKHSPGLTRITLAEYRQILREIMATEAELGRALDQFGN